jgi:hypothetical protein
MAASGAGEGVTASIWRVIIALGGHAVGIIGGSARLAAQHASLDGRRAIRYNGASNQPLGHSDYSHSKLHQIPCVDRVLEHL